MKTCLMLPLGSGRGHKREALRGKREEGVRSLEWDYCTTLSSTA